MSKFSDISPEIRSPDRCFLKRRHTETSPRKTSFLLALQSIYPLVLFIENESQYQNYTHLQQVRDSHAQYAEWVYCRRAGVVEERTVDITSSVQRIKPCS